MSEALVADHTMGLLEHIVRAYVPTSHFRPFISDLSFFTLYLWCANEGSLSQVHAARSHGTQHKPSERPDRCRLQLFHAIHGIHTTSTYED